jgi:hypothetical protein
MGEREAAEWQAIFERVGPDQLPRETHGLLETFCNLKTSLDDLNAALRALGPGLPEEQAAWCRYRELTKLRGALVGQLCSVATKLRMTPQARYDRHRAGAAARRRPSMGLPPWAPGDEPLIR